MRVLLVGLLALVLVTQAAAAANRDTSTPRATAKAPERQRAAKTLDERLDRKLTAARKHRGTIRFFANHRRLFGSGERSEVADEKLGNAKRRLARLEREISGLRSAIATRDARRRASMPPRQAICSVFGEYCRQAVAVAWCESRLTTTAQNGQYLGLFQMGSTARRLFGHGPTAHAQAVAAHKYFVRSGHDWSPWGCRWAAS